MHTATQPTSFNQVGTITYSSTNVVWLPTDKSGVSPARSGQALGFTFEGPGSVIDAVMLIAPTAKKSPQSPFSQLNPIQLTREGEDYFISPPIDQQDGMWGFSIMFRTQNDAGEHSGFYFLPDPELAVGSYLPG